jgi:hypothetical protein
MTDLDSAPPGEHAPTERWREVAPGAVFLVLGAVILVLARSIELPDRAMAVSPRIWPEVLGIGIMALSVTQIVAAFVAPRRGDAEEPADRPGVFRVLGFVLATLAFGVLWYYVHFLVSGFLFGVTLTWIAGGRGLKDLLLFPAGITVVLYTLFALLLRVPI